MSRLMGALGAVLLAASGLQAGTVFEQDFASVPDGPLPDPILVLDGQFAVKAEGSDRFAELPGAPLESYGFLFGPPAASGREVQARIHGTRSGRKFPTFAVGLNGVNGYKLRVSPAKNALELVSGESLEVRATVPFAWKSGEWTRLKLRLVPAGKGVVVEAKAWQSAEEPKEWALRYEAPEAPPSGMAGAWGMPYSGTPIRFDDLRVSTTE